MLGYICPGSFDWSSVFLVLCFLLPITFLGFDQTKDRSFLPVGSWDFGGHRDLTSVNGVMQIKMKGGLGPSGSNGNDKDDDLGMTIKEMLETKEKVGDDHDLKMTIREILDMNSNLRYEEIDRELKEMKK